PGSAVDRAVAARATLDRAVPRLPGSRLAGDPGEGDEPVLDVHPDGARGDDVRVVRAVPGDPLLGAEDTLDDDGHPLADRLPHGEARRRAPGLHREPLGLRVAPLPGGVPVAPGRPEAELRRL